ncbi:Na+/H+ antiporter subunit E [Wenzhouxiangella sp. AB-CW3]|uniref:Na+/H+ antiporter subunit E n=1 Tax=Wenzhouxiangella sp. AB-CW3 TaxID=2771012 RepID=UPI00168BFFCA|nr:Na+/H+ antiporter subunit E [Wenzhouxiangella sp. AB-CW3]QOC22151.1 Na+/H+ antiporter subunit E [Wenzhouxiangella sp. AB-CW3]
MSIRYVISLTLILATLWLAISGVYKPVILFLGAGSVALVVWLSLRMEVVGVEHNPGLFSWRLPLYWAWLLWQIVISNLNVAHIILSPSRVRPRIFSVPIGHETAVAKVTYANSVTLTPGTVTLLLDEDELTVHALDVHSARELESGAMDEKIAWLEGSKRERP